LRNQPFDLDPELTFPVRWEAPFAPERPEAS